MKKFAMSAIAVAAVLGAGAANAYTMGTFSNGFVVPNVIHDATGATTAVGIINQSAITVPVFWTFFDQESNHVVDGCFTMTAKDYEPFVWSQKSGTGLAGQRGYLVFAVGNSTAGTCAIGQTLAASGSGALIAGNAFFVDPVRKDVAYTPVIDGPLTIGGSATDLSTLDAGSLTQVAGAAQVGASPRFSLRYFIDGVANSGTNTNIVVWSTGDQTGTYTVNMYDAAQNRQSVNFKLDHAELDWFDPELIAGRPASFVDGFIDWKLNVGALPTGAPSTGALLGATTGSVFTYSVIDAPAFGAVQTVLGAHSAN
ncbi:hypothetical protein [Ottowia oryzae]|uniref:PEP-CTERM sorting domain-containing protein n=1 Tax=Ottowia oryzae TaxID=2109914 RepID=A0A2S0MAM7_9BURK|nr:hypothetical protein [Ottowia oryzae]AVO32954.1 hypothetical protein C6570_00780 [Ottowia oryzae]